MNKHEKIQTDKSPAAIGPYCQGTMLNGMIFTSGQIPVDPVSGETPADFAAQAELVMKNLAGVLEAAGSGFDKVLKTTCFLADMADFPVFNEIYARCIEGSAARSCVAVKTLPKGVLCEVEAIAYK